MIIKAEDAPEMREENYPLIAKKIIHRETHIAKTSATWVSIWGYHKKMVCDVSDRLYYIIDGEGEFTVGRMDWARFPGDDVFIPRGVPYFFDRKLIC